MLRRTGALACTLALLSLPACDKSPAKADKSSAESDADKADGEDPPDSNAVEAEPGVDASSVLALGAAKIMREGHPDRAIELTPAGQVSLAGKPFMVLSASGELHDPQGELIMTVSGDGSVSGSEGPTGIELRAKGGSYQSDSLELDVSFADDGTIAVEASGANAGLLGSGSPDLVSEGCAGTMTQTCALVTLNYLMALGSPDSPKAE